MPKFIAHIIVALALWYGLSHFGVSVWARLPAIVAGAFGVHWFWETFFPVDPAYFGHLPIAQDDPLMLAARQRGRETLDTFRRLYPEHPNDTIVRFGMQMPSGNKEYLWADLLSLEADTATVYIRTPPTEPGVLTSMNMIIPFADIDD